MSQDIPQLIASARSLLATLPYQATERLTLTALVDALEAGRQAIINSPETADFAAAVPIEAAHQRERWPSHHDADKAPEDWVFLLGYLGGKACVATRVGDLDKARHHAISAAAVLANWHAALTHASTAPRPGIQFHGEA